jgi:hypothetical protein
MVATKKRQRSDQTSAQALAGQGAQLCSTTHHVVMESIWNTLHKNPELACQIHVMISNKSFEKEELKEDRWLTSNNKMHLAPRDIFDQILADKLPALSDYYKTKKAKKDKVMEIVCFVADLDLNCAVLSKHVDTLMEKVSARWDEMVETRLAGFPADGMAVTDADVQKMGYFELKVVEGITYIKHKFSDQEAKLHEELQGKTWALESNLNHKKATIKSGDLHEFLVSKVFSLVEGLAMPTPMCLKQVPVEDQTRKTPTTPRTPAVASPTSSGGSATTLSRGWQLSSGSGAEVLVPLPPPPPGMGGALD